ncbi:lipopolysaccharide biosynthesis protein [Thalassotalea sp. 1_MG-2023]|uniref:lipopolysaccharide biosynthesis protein n=1 Tax=Thalassotalea sp. 1_MG-2023 TaxID=3062680 RepID=UPI0026E4848E|nr:lipopolysaccharide biosynthesis protein [Thalassotalea sp. 1_MG-2023]MDO6426505.1 lipopolysaccharide biosynthesis protein [Thalassotalea sp. 1_MG-2023]
MRKDLSAIFTVLTGTAGAQVITLAFTPLLTRIFSPEAFGHLGVFLALFAILMPITALTLPMAVVLAKSNNEAKALTKLSMYLALLVSLVFTLFIVINKQWLVNVLNAKGNGSYLYWVPVAVLCGALLQLGENWTIKLSLFKLRAKVSILHALIINALKLVIGFFIPHAITLIAIAIVNPLLNGLLLGVPIRNALMHNTEDDKHERPSYQQLTTKYRDFPLFQSPQALLNALSQSGPVIVLAAFFGPVSAGFYTFSRTILAIPITLMGKAVGDVCFGRFSKQINQQQFDDARKYFIQTTSSLAVVALLPLGIVWFYGPELFSWVFGDAWYQAGMYAKWLSLWTYFILINAPSLKMIIALKKQKRSLLVNVISMPIRMLVLIAGALYTNDEWLALKLFVVASILHNVVIIALAYYCCCKECDKISEEN